MSTLLYSKWIANKDLLYRPGNSSQCYASLDGRGVWWRMDTCICMAESLQCSRETTPILLISYVFVLVAQSCPTLCDPTGCSSPGSSVHGLFQAIILEWVAISFTRGSSQPRNQTQVSCIAGRFSFILILDGIALAAHGKMPLRPKNSKNQKGKT